MMPTMTDHSGSLRRTVRMFMGGWSHIFPSCTLDDILLPGSTNGISLLFFFKEHGADVSQRRCRSPPIYGNERQTRRQAQRFECMAMGTLATLGDISALCVWEVPNDELAIELLNCSSGLPTRPLCTLMVG